MNVAIIHYDPASPGTYTNNVKTDLETWGHTVTIVDTQNVTSGSYLSGQGYDFAVIMDEWRYGGATGMAETAASDIPLISLIGGGESDLRIGTGGANHFSTDVDITDATDAVPVQGGWSSGTQSWSISAIREVTGTAAGASVFGEKPTTLEDFFIRYDSGDTMTSGTAEELRLHCGMYQYGSTANEEEVLQTFVEAVVAYLSSKTPWSLYPSGRSNIDGATIVTSDTFKIALLDSGHTITTSHTKLADLATDITGTAQVVTLATSAQQGRTRWDSSAVLSFSGPITNQKYAVLYDDTTASDLLVAYTNFGQTQSVASGVTLSLPTHTMFER